MDVDWFHDVRTAYTATANLRTRSTKEYCKDVVSTQNFNAYVALLTKGCSNHSSEMKTSLYPTSAKFKKNQRFLPFEEPAIPFNIEAARKQLAEMQTSISLNGMRLFLW